MGLHIVILAAGKGTRMHSNLPKVLQPLGGIPLLEHVVNAAKELNPKKIHVVYGDSGELVKEKLAHLKVNWIEQKKQLGTGHAVLQVLPYIPDNSQVLILYGDVPLISALLLEELITDAPSKGIGLITAELTDPSGFGRIVRDPFGNLTEIVEHKDATKTELQIKEINTGILIASAKLLKKYLPKLNQHNAQGEYYLTDIISMSTSDNIQVTGLVAFNPEEILGVNDKIQLAHLERYYQNKIAQNFMRQGVTIIDPTRFDVRGNLQIAADVSIDINNIFEGNVSVGSNTTIGPNNYLKNVTIGNNVIIRANCVLEDCIIEDDCIVGPFARIRPTSHLKAGAHVGNFVELKNCILGKKSKANHLTYLGDVIIGNDVNIGAGTITCNYDGANKHRTIIEDGVFVGSDVQFIAPVKIGKNATIGAGSTIVSDVPKGKLAIARAKQVHIDSWQRPKKKSSK